MKIIDHAIFYFIIYSMWLAAKIIALMPNWLLGLAVSSAIWLFKVIKPKTYWKLRRAGTVQELYESGILKRPQRS